MSGDLDAIRALKARHRGRLLVLGHHYQRPEIVAVSDIVGDSFELSRKAAAVSGVDHVVFCGVHFMAESAEVLSPPGRTVQSPEPAAGCPMADMATPAQVEVAWAELEGVFGPRPAVPVVYMNSSAAVKASCGRRDGSVCTSSNAATVVKWGLASGARVLFFPDEHLGRNTARGLGLPPEQVVLWNPFRPLGGLDPDRLRAARLILWRGFCLVHQAFTLRDVARVRARYPGARLYVHPECREEVVQAADGAGSTAWLVKVAQDAPAGATVVIGTEVNLVDRLAAELADKRVVPLRRSLCKTMDQITLPKLRACLERPGELNVIRVPDELRADARRALERMLALCA